MDICAQFILCVRGPWVCVEATVQHRSHSAPWALCVWSRACQSQWTGSRGHPRICVSNSPVLAFHVCIITWIFLKKSYLLCSVLPACSYTHMYTMCLQCLMSEDRSGPAGVTGGCEPPGECWEPVLLSRVISPAPLSVPHPSPIRFPHWVLGFTLSPALLCPCPPPSASSGDQPQVLGLSQQALYQTSCLLRAFQN